MVAAWPLTTYRKLAWKYARPLDASGAEFTDLLIAETVEQQDWIRAAWQVLMSNSKSDVITLPYVRTGTDLNLTLASLQQKMTLHRDISVYARLRDEEEWEAYYESLSGKHRRHHAQSRRRLAELGTVEFEIVEAGDPRCPELVGWMLAQKRIWAERTNKKGHWLFSDGYCEFLRRLLADSEANPKRLIMSLRLNGAPIAVKITAAGGSLLEGLIAGYDPQYEKHSPGIRLDEYMVRWAFEHKLDYDFGNGGEQYKRFWSRDTVIETATYHIATSWWGRAALYLQRKKAAREVRPVSSTPVRPEAGDAETSGLNKNVKPTEQLRPRNGNIRHERREH